MLGNLRLVSQEHIALEVAKADRYCNERRAALITEWQDNLFRLNDAINRRVGTLKDMEADLEETLRLALAQNEIEACVFEQTSCARMDNFWVQSRAKLDALGRDLKDAQREMLIVRMASGTKGGKKERELDGLLELPDLTEPHPSTHGGSAAANSKGTKAKKTLLQSAVTGSGQRASTGVLNPNPSANPDEGDTIPDTVRVKRVLDEIRSEYYREFNYQLTRSLEQVRPNPKANPYSIFYS